MCGNTLVYFPSHKKVLPHLSQNIMFSHIFPSRAIQEKGWMKRREEKIEEKYQIKWKLNNWKLVNKYFIQNIHTNFKTFRMIFFTRNIFSNLMISFSGLLVLLFSGFPEAECATQEFHLKAINRTLPFNLRCLFWVI